MDYGNAVVADELAGSDLEKSHPIIYDREIEVRTLYEDPVSGAEHYLIRYPAGLQTKMHRHTEAHTFVVLEGRLEVNGRIIGPGAYAHFPAGEPMVHRPAENESCLFVVVFTGPVDMTIVAD